MTTQVLQLDEKIFAKDLSETQNQALFENLKGSLDIRSHVLTFYEKRLYEHFLTLVGEHTYEYQMVSGIWTLETRSIELLHKQTQKISFVEFNGLSIILFPADDEFITTISYYLENWEFNFKKTVRISVTRKREPGGFEDYIQYWVRNKTPKKKSPT
jgi:hypothetical protein